MPTILSDPSTTLYALLTIMVLVLGGLWFRSRKRGDLFRFLLGVAALVSLILIDYFVESPREEATRKMQEISSLTKQNKMDDAFKNISDAFSYNGKNKAWLRDKARHAESQGVSGVDMTGFHRADFERLDDNKIKIGFEVWPSGYGLPQYRFFCWATFQKDPDGQFRMQTFDLYQKRPNHPDEKPIVPELLQ